MVSLACFRISHDIDPRGENAAQDEGASTPWCQGDTALSCKVVKFKNDREALAFVRAVAPYLPAYHYGQLAWSAVGAATERMPVALAWLAGYTALFLAIAFRAYRREESRKFG